ncbi:MAG: YchJ family metal-binding protein [Desulfocapsaceae bacterium]|nr:YchJ family metal-binding protein [Desulfocapsaceae bacterium]
MTNTATCPCNSDQPYVECCEPLLSGDRRASTAEALMRSRYTANVVHDVAYLLRSWHPSTRPDTIDPSTIPEWCGLHIVRTEKGMESDIEGVVEFKASSFIQKKPWQLHEVSRFVKEDGQWLYVDGDIKDDALPGERRGAKIGRNDPCHCGSGNKFKKCCSR